MRKAFNILFNSLRTLSFTKLLQLLKLTVPHPFLALMGVYATLKCFQIAKQYFPKTNSTNGIGNAFRHSLWTCMIAMYCCKISSPKKSLDFCRKMTDLHEELFPNEALGKKMDLHNNQIGIELFTEMLPGIHRQFFETSFFVELLLEKTKTAKILENIDEDYGSFLIYLDK